MAAPLVVIVGPTASGKSALAIEIAEKFNGEIICADSRTVYKGLDIGTAKPSRDEQAKVPHHLLDIINPDQKYTAADFKHDSLELIKEISARGRLPIVAGGTGLYIDSLIYDYKFSGPGVERDDKNPRHLKSDETRTKHELRPNTLVIGLQLDKTELEQRIRTRTDEMFKNGLQDEVGRLKGKYGWETEPMKGIGYREWKEYFEGTQSLDETRERVVRASLGLAKRQRTWFKRNQNIQWCDSVDEATTLVEHFFM